jgi:hypothetical protein
MISCYLYKAVCSADFTCVRTYLSPFVYMTVHHCKRYSVNSYCISGIYNKRKTIYNAFTGMLILSVHKYAQIFLNCSDEHLKFSISGQSFFFLHLNAACEMQKLYVLLAF